MKFGLEAARVHFDSLPEPWDFQVFGPTSFCLWFWGCVWMRLILKLVERVNQIDLPNMNGLHPINRREIKADRPPSEREFLLLDCFDTGESVFSYHWTQSALSALPGSWFCCLLEWSNKINFAAASACWLLLQILELVSFHHCVSQFLIMNLLLSVLTFIISYLHLYLCHLDLYVHLSYQSLYHLSSVISLCLLSVPVLWWTLTQKPWMWI